MKKSKVNGRCSGLAVFSGLCVALAFWLAANPALARDPKTGVVAGRIVDINGAPVALVSVTLKNRLYERTITVDGAFRFEKAPAGDYVLTASAPGFETVEREGVVVVPGQITEVDLSMNLSAIELSEVVAAPSQFSFLRRPVASRQYLDRDDIRNAPHLADDLYRVVNSAPGVSGNDISAAFNVRGGDYREVLVTLDGMELYEPFHVKDFTGVFSIVDPEIVGGLNLATGGYSAQYGNALSGVMTMESASPSQRKSSLGVSLGNLSYRTEGSFASGLGQYLFSARRGYLDILLGFTEDDEEEEEEDTSIAYWDSYGKAAYALGERHFLSGHFLLAGDRFEETENEDGEMGETDSNYDNYYLWANLDSAWSDALSSRTTLYWSAVETSRVAGSRGGEVDFDLSDKRDFTYFGLKQGWEYELSDRQLLRWGFDVKSVDGDYDYFGETRSDDPITRPAETLFDFATAPSGEEIAGYASWRLRASARLVADLSVRYDRQSFLDDSQTSPRLNLAYDMGAAGTLRFALGRYHQAQRIHELPVADGVFAFWPAERSDHWLLGYERRIGAGVDFRVEAYVKDVGRQNPRFENMLDSISMFPALENDRFRLDAVSARVRGIEASFKQNLGGRLSWLVNYAFSKAEDELENGDKVPRQWDQRHSLNASLNYRKSDRWNIGLAWTYHTGWRTTPFFLETDGEGIGLGDLYSEKFPAFHRLDLRANRRLFRRNGNGLDIYLDVSNLYNRKNVRGYDNIAVETGENGQPILTFEREEWLPILPTFGVNWTF